MFSGQGGGGGDEFFLNHHSDVLSNEAKNFWGGAGEDEKREKLIAEIKKRGNFAFAKKSLKEAELLYSKAIEILSFADASTDQQIQAGLHLFYGNRSASRCSMDKSSLALEDANAAIKLMPDWSKGYFRKASAYLKQKNYSMAVSSFEDMFAAQVREQAITTMKNGEPTKAQLALLKTFEETKEKAAKAAAEPAPAASCAKKTITKTTVVSKTEEQKPIKVTTEDEKIEKIRGYKKLADGRVTTFFNNELTKEEKELIGDIAPKKIEDEDKVQIKAVTGGSAWNEGTSFEEKDMTTWAYDNLKAKLANIEVDLNGIGKIKVVDMKDISGDASIAVVRRGKRYIFDIMFTLQCELSLQNGQNVKGDLKFLDMSSDCNGDFETEVCVSNRHHDKNSQLLHDVLSNKIKGFQEVVFAKLGDFVKDFHQN